MATALPKTAAPPQASPDIPKLALQSLAKGFGRGKSPRIEVVRDFDLDVTDLEFLSVIGPSGCGKSTLLRLIDGLIEADGGRVLMDGRDISGRVGGEGRGMVFQSFDLFPWRTTQGNVEFGLEAKGVPRAERAPLARHYIDLVGLTGFEDAYPHELSGGMQQRAGFARALAIKPEILLMDEPFGALDVQTRDILQNELLSIWEKEQKTVLFVTHSIEEAIYLSDRIAVITPRPARVERIIDVPFPRPRNESMKHLPLFLEMRREIWSVLKAGVKV